MKNLVGSQFGKFRLLKLLGQGSFAQVYLGEHVDLKTLVAIKILTSPFNVGNGDTILKEAQTIARLNHPHIVRVWDFDVYDSFPYLVMDYYPNDSLRQRYPRRSVLPLDVAISYTAQVAKALQYAHDHSIVHRDVKPENLLLNQHDEVVLTDFGIATMTQSIYQTKQEVAGTAAYMAPEQFKGNTVRASDQYALGVIVYEWLAGGPPFEGSFVELAGQHLLRTPPPIRAHHPLVPVKVEEVIMRSLMKEPQQRYTTVQEFADALVKAHQFNATPTIISDSGRRKQRRRLGKWAGVSLLLSLFLVVSLVSAGLMTGILRLPPNPCMGFSDKFQQNNIDGWTWINPTHQSTHTIEADPKNANRKVFHISSPGLPPYEDLNPLKTGNMNAPRLVQPIDGDFTIETEINFISKVEGYQGVALLIWQDDQHFLRLEVSTWKGEGYGVNFSYYYDRTHKGDDNGGRIAIDEVATKLRVERRGNLYTASWQQYNGEWIPITRTFRMSSDRVQAGLLLMDTQAIPHTGSVSPADAYYHYFHYTCDNG